MDLISLFAGAIGIGPALLLMFYTLAPYTAPKVELPFFDDRKVFTMLTVGLVLGVIVATIRLYFDMSDIVMAIFFSLFILFVPMVILLMKRFTLRLDTAFYGCALGLGMGATMAFQLSYRVLFKYNQAWGNIPLETYLIVAIWVFQMVLIMTVTATMIGIGSARGRPWYYFGQALLLMVVFNLLSSSSPDGENVLSYIPFVLATIYTFMCYFYIKYRSLPELVEEALKRMGKRKKKKVEA